jgi:hypothetical protein
MVIFHCRILMVFMVMLIILVIWASLFSGILHRLLLLALFFAGNSGKGKGKQGASLIWLRRFTLVTK